MTARRWYRWVDRALARMDPETVWERMVSLHVSHQVPVLGVASTPESWSGTPVAGSTTAATT